MRDALLMTQDMVGRNLSDILGGFGSNKKPRWQVVSGSSLVEVLRKALRAEPLFYALTDTIGFLTAFV